MEDSYAGWNNYVIVERTTECPVGTVITDDGESDGNIVYRNGIYYLSSAFAAPYDTWIPTVTGWQIDVETGEIRYYAASGVLAEYFTPMQRAIGKVKNIRITNERTVEKDRALGEIHAVDLKSQQFDVNFEMPKTFIDKRKIAAISRTSPLENQAGFGGPGVVSIPRRWEPYAQSWYLVIVYQWDASSDSDNVARILIMPCAKFSKYETSAENDKLQAISLSGSATYVFYLPDDSVNIEDYTPTGTPP